MSWTTYDFVESVRIAGIKKEEIASVEAGWGQPGDGNEWAGGFLMRLHDGTFAYVTGWCDYTGWGCQDGADLHRFAQRPKLDALDVEYAYGKPIEWEADPAGPNRWLRGEINEFD